MTSLACTSHAEREIGLEDIIVSLAVGLASRWQHVPPRHEEVVSLVQCMVELMRHVPFEAGVEQRVEVHDREGVDAVEGAVMARE